MKLMNRQELNSTLASVAVYEQAKAHLIKQGKPVTEFIESRLKWLYEQVTPSVIRFVKKDLVI